MAAMAMLATWETELVPRGFPHLEDPPSEQANRLVYTTSTTQIRVTSLVSAISVLINIQEKNSYLDRDLNLGPADL